ncbi:MAG TPA: methyltransferase domain-containing protein, partial [Gammaproteobacteria bacterium]|nr:methyltransferase domain-containing protein [Gammaproteobacteria bacterium]
MKRSMAREMMDSPDNPRELLEDDLRNLRIINRYLGNYRAVLGALARLIAEQRLQRFSLLDVGTGSADIPALIASWARHHHLTARLIGVEPEPVTLQAAVNQTRDYPEIALIRGDARALPLAPHSVDFVLSSQMLHHFSEDDIVNLLRGWSRVARRAIIVCDLVRHPLAYYGIRLVTKVFTRNIMTRTDGPLSVQRAFTLDEWRGLFERAGIGPFRILPKFPFRQITIFSMLEQKSGSRLRENQNLHSSFAGSSAAPCDLGPART